MRRRVFRTIITTSAVALAIAGLSPGVAGGVEDPYLTLGPDAPAGSTLTPIINSGETFGDDFMFEGIPDGLGWIDNDDGTVDVYVAHEQSRVPFLGEADFVDSSVSRLTLDASNPASILGGDVPLPPSAGFIRFCSAFIAGEAEGFDEPTFFANEESNDVISVPAGAVYGPDPSLAPQRQAGYAVALNTVTGDYDVIAGMGRHNHENTVVVPGDWDGVAALSGDDTFNAPSSQLYMYLASSPDALLADQGQLFGLRVTHTDAGPVDELDPFNGANDYGDIETGEDWAGRFVRVPRKVALGTTKQRPQDALENWSNENNIFQFIRVEDIAYDRNDPHVVYFADTGERRAIPNPETGRLMRGGSSTFGPYPNGRIFRIELGTRDPRKVVSFSILLDADAGGYNNPSVMHQPDNMDTSQNSLMVQEDSGQAPNSRIWRYDLATQMWSVVASVNQASWESSGIVDASAVFGDGAWLVDVQAHGSAFWVDSEMVGGVTYKREAGQLLLMKLPGT
jgi:hypothetical protein